MHLSNKKIIKLCMVCLLSIVGACTDTVKGGADNSPRLTLNDKSVIVGKLAEGGRTCLLYTSPSPRDVEESRMPSSA